MAVPKEFARRALNLLDFIPFGAEGQASPPTTAAIACLCLVLRIVGIAITVCNQSGCVNLGGVTNPDFMPGFLTDLEPLRQRTLQTVCRTPERTKYSTGLSRVCQEIGICSC